MDRSTGHNSTDRRTDPAAGHNRASTGTDNTGASDAGTEHGTAVKPDSGSVGSGYTGTDADTTVDSDGDI